MSGDSIIEDKTLKDLVACALCDVRLQPPVPLDTS